MFDAKVVRSAALVHLIGESEKNSFILENARRYTLIPNGCMPDTCLSLPCRELVFGYMGRLEIEQKGVDLLLLSFLKYKEGGGKGVLKIAGEGTDIDDLVKIINKSPFGSSVSLVGVVYDEHKWEFLNGCAFFCHPSLWDVFPTGTLEAASMGVPLIVSRATDMDAYVNKYRAGRVLDKRDMLVDTMFEMEAIFYDNGKYSEMCANASQMIEKELNWDVVADLMIGEYEKL